MSRIRKIGRGLFAVAVLGALSLGATQAFATPRTEPAARGLFCLPGPCNRNCVNQGYAAGGCVDGVCECVF